MASQESTPRELDPAAEAGVEVAPLQDLLHSLRSPSWLDSVSGLWLVLRARPSSRLYQTSRWTSVQWLQPVTNIE
tara:strand:+ start:175 stop:399 length:225 start_codon:yes stop_codon:yes gene_type:complete